jgi:hypothetical protein
MADVERGDEVRDRATQGSAGGSDGTKGALVAVGRMVRECLEGARR